MAKLVSFDQDKTGATYLFEGIDTISLAHEVGQLFLTGGYKLEKGTSERGIYGKGNVVLRILFGGFAPRYKFNFEIYPEGNHVKLKLSKGMTGASGGLLGHSKMNTEFVRIVDMMKTLG